MRNAQCVMRNVISFILGFILLAGQVASAERLDPVTDKAKLLDKQEIKQLNQKIRNIEQAHKIKIGVAFVKSIKGQDIITAADDFLRENFNNGKNGGIVLLVDMGNRKYEITTDTRMTEIITDNSGVPALKESFQSELSAGNYYGAVNNFVDGVDELLTYYETNGVPYGQRKPGEIDPVAAVVAAATAIFLGVFIRSILIGSMSNIHRAMAAIDYLKKKSVKITENRDTFLFMNVQRRAKSSGGGKRSGGSGHSGGFGGGGGSF